MRIVVVGAGVVGFHLAEQLSGEGHDVSVVDSDPRLVRRIDERLDVLAVAGDAAVPSVLSRAGTEQADLVVAVTDADTTNLVVSLVARRLGAKQSIVRVRDAELSDPSGVLPPDAVMADIVINPLQTTAEVLERLVRNPGSTDFSEFADGELMLWGFSVAENSPLVDLPLHKFRETANEIHALIVAIQKHDGSFVIPTGEDVISANDHLYVFIHRKMTKQFRQLVQPDAPAIERVVIHGASRYAVAVAAQLEPKIKQVVVIDPEREHAEEASKSLSKALVLCGDLSEKEFAREAGISEAHYFLALANDDQTNVMNALLARKYGVERVAVMAQHPEFVPVLQSLHLGCVVNPRLLTVSAILGFIRRGAILRVSRIGESGAEAREYIVPAGSPLAGLALKDIKLPKGVIVGAIFKDESYRIPTGDTVLDPDDHVIIFSLPDAARVLEKLFAKRKIFGR